MVCVKDSVVGKDGRAGRKGLHFWLLVPPIFVLREYLDFVMCPFGLQQARTKLSVISGDFILRVYACTVHADD